ncbi:MAG TPA: hypothetical protein VFV95_06435 [Vicinamibacterales bacterium]|nr:hypothetical protein [Vicinamibacterales bacterium]
MHQRVRAAVVAAVRTQNPVESAVMPVGSGSGDAMALVWTSR